MSNIWEKVTANAKLISLPDVYIRLKSVLNDPDFCMADVANVISHDAAMTTRLLRLVNSAYFGFAAKIDTVNRAVSMLGTQQVHDLVLATSVTKTFSNIDSNVVDMQSFWQQSVYTAVAARLLASACNVLDSERLFVAGLLHDIGHLIMYQQIPEYCSRAISLAEETRRPLFRVERELIGFDYAQVGGMLMHEWNLPRSLREATELHVEPSRSFDHALETALVHIAVHMAQAAMSGDDIEQAMIHADPAAWTITDLSPNQCPAIHLEAQEQVFEVLGLIMPEENRKSA